MQFLKFRITQSLTGLLVIFAFNSITEPSLAFNFTNVYAAEIHIGFSRSQTRHGFEEYQSIEPESGFKVFMVARDGAYAWAVKRSFDMALKSAQKECAKYAAPHQCDLYAVGGTIVWGMSEQQKKSVISAYRVREAAPGHQFSESFTDSLPDSVTVEGADAISEYTFWNEGPNLFKVLALMEEGALGWSAGFSYEEAERDAIETCENAPGSRRGLCRVYAVGDTVVWRMSAKEIQSVISTYKSSKISLGLPATRAPLRFSAIRGFRSYQQASDYKFFAVGNGSWGRFSGPSFELALKETMSICNKYADKPCELFAVGGTIVWGLSDEKVKTILEAYQQR